MSERPHIRRALLDAYFYGGASHYELVAEVARLLEAECADCEAALVGSRPRYERALREATRRMRARLLELDEERLALPGALQDLDTGTGPDALLQVAGDRRFHTAAFVEYETAAAWAALDAEAWQAAGQAVELAAGAAMRLEAARYGKIAVARLQAEAELARARVSMARGGDREGEQALEVAERLAPATLSDDIEAGLLLGKAVSAMRMGEEEGARRLLLRAAALARRGESDRWGASVETTLAILDRREGRPELAAQRLRELVSTGGGGPSETGAWRSARELVRSLVASGEADEAAAFLVALEAEKAGAFLGAWEAEGEGARADAARAELAHLQGLVLQAMGSPHRAREVLRWAFRAHVTLGRGLAAVGVLTELVRVESAGPGGWLDRAAEDLVACRDLPAEAVEALSILVGSWLRGAVAPEEIEDFEERLLHVDPPWRPAGHERR